MLNRNEKLAIEVGRLRLEVRSLKQKISALVTWKLTENLRMPSQFLKTDACTQYEDQSFTDDAYFTPKLNRKREFRLTPEESLFISQDENIENIHPNTPITTTPILTPTKVSPSQIRVKETLSARIMEEEERTNNHAALGRTPRSVRKPVTYKEPSLRVKVRKGFEFFKFTERNNMPDDQA